MGKIFSEHKFKINDELTASCRAEKTQYGFRHLAELYKNDYQVATAKCTYSNRTWERYEFQSVLYALLEKAKIHLSEAEIKDFQKTIESDEGVNRDMESLGAIGTIAKLGEIFTDNKKDNNNWKKRMLKAGLGEGVDLPDDFDDLPEEEKERRLNGAINILTDKERG